MFKYILAVVSLAAVWMLQQLYEVYIFGNQLVIFSTRDDSFASGFQQYALGSMAFSGLNSAHTFYLISCFVQAWLIFMLSKSLFFALFITLLSLGLGGIKVLLILLGIGFGHPQFGDIQYLVSLLVQFFSLPFVPILLLFIKQYKIGQRPVQVL